MHERKSQLQTSGLYGRTSKALAGDGNTGRFSKLLGVGYRLDHSPLLIAQEKGSEGHTLHGGAITEAGEPAWPLVYEF